MATRRPDLRLLSLAAVSLAGILGVLWASPARAADSGPSVNDSDFATARLAAAAAPAGRTWIWKGRGGPVLVLSGDTRRGRTPLPDVVRAHPEAFAHTTDGALILRIPLVVSRGAHLVVDSAQTPEFLLAGGEGLSGPAHVAITALYGSMRFVGHPDQPLRIRSIAVPAGLPVVPGWAPLADPGPALRVTDGRAYIVNRAGTMQLEHVIASHLGSGTGATSGVAWMALSGTAARGGANDSVFEHNYFGAYASGAIGLRLADVVFRDNTVYGFDPHTGTNGLILKRALAERNGRHGVILSRGCHDALIADSTARDNGGSGFVIDDGNPAAGSLVGSDRNRIIGVVAENNGGSGVVIEGGTGNSVLDSRVTGNDYGVWVRGGSSTTVAANVITGARFSGVRLSDGARSTAVAGNTVTGGVSGVEAADLTGDTRIRNNRVSDSSGTAIRLADPLGALEVSNVALVGRAQTPATRNGTVLAATALPGLDIVGWAQPPLVSGRWATTLAVGLHMLAALQWTLVLLLPVALVVAHRRRRRQPGPWR